MTTDELTVKVDPDGSISQVSGGSLEEPLDTGRTVGLDAERLAQAWHMTQLCVHGAGTGEPMQKPGYLKPDREVVALIIEEYERLGNR